MKPHVKIGICVFASLIFATATWAQTPLTATQRSKVEAQLKVLSALGTDANVVSAVKGFNMNPPVEALGMTQDKWTGLSVLSPEVRYFAKTQLAEYLKGKRNDVITELFVNAADGTKVAFFAKTTSWSHKGKPKHEIPMSGKTWIGDPEQDQSTGKTQVQIAFPILDGKTVIGSVVIGLDLGKL